METATSPYEKCVSVQRLRLFSEISPTDCRTIVSTAREKRFSRRETIFFEGDPVRQVVLLLSGCVKITQLGYAGAEVILRLSGVGDIVGGFCGPFPTCSHCSTAQAIRPSTALVWQAATFDKLLDRFPAFERSTVRALEERLQELEQRFRDVSTDMVSSRLSNELIRLSNHLASASGNAEIGLSRSELAQLTGTTVFTVSRLLTRWQTLGIVSGRREAVRVLDFAALAQFSEREGRKSGCPPRPCTALASGPVSHNALTSASFRG
jgi:CRP/FNR family transcriptional regulator, nitrogen oxide reductase regulator